jgi:LytS/YehU family sensor histidine kinase
LAIFSKHSVDVTKNLRNVPNFISQHILNNAISKIGALSSKDLGRMRMIEKEFLEDVFIDFNNYNGQILKELDDEQNKWIMERVKADILQLISIVTSKNDRSG